mmetsp:Transcript_25622/g.59119  ORF Transcript_25622/g.59119 Transcript_25622/m.59119 type:complete len:220 (-) Transcript_25622:29-688(-)
MVPRVTFLSLLSLLLFLSRPPIIHGKKYPGYCSKPDVMASRSIPPVLTETSLELLQVHVLIRHGSRTPYSDYYCWSYDGSVAPRGIAPWNCDGVSTVMAPHNTSAGFGEGDLLLFDKVYDALSPPVTNELGGTCLVGELLQEGYNQQVANGRILRAAYVETSKDSMRLFASARYADRPYERSARFRGDDQQRTLLSGQTLVSSLFDADGRVVVPWHTAD